MHPLALGDRGVRGVCLLSLVQPWQQCRRTDTYPPSLLGHHRGAGGQVLTAYSQRAEMAPASFHPRETPNRHPTFAPLADCLKFAVESFHI